MTPEPPLVLFVDRSLGSKGLPQALRDDGHTVVIHDNHFPDPTTEDVVWLEEVGQRGWVALSKDVAIRQTPHEREVLVTAKLRAFFLARQNLPSGQQISAFRAAMPEILRLAQTHLGRPLIATVFLHGGIRIDFSEQVGE